MSTQRRIRKSVVRFLKKYHIIFHTVSLILIAISIPISLAFFPDDTVATFVMVSISGLTSAIGTLADSLISVDDSIEEDEKQGKSNKDS